MEPIETKQSMLELPSRGSKHTIYRPCFDMGTCEVGGLRTRFIIEYLLENHFGCTYWSLLFYFSGLNLVISEMHEIDQWSCVYIIPVKLCYLSYSKLLLINKSKIICHLFVSVSPLNYFNNAIVWTVGVSQAQKSKHRNHLAPRNSRITNLGPSQSPCLVSMLRRLTCINRFSRPILHIFVSLLGRH